LSVEDEKWFRFRYGFGGREFVVNEGELLVSIGDEVEEFGVESGSASEECDVRIGNNFGMEAESDVGGGLNDGVQEGVNGIVLECENVVAANGELELVKGDGV